jgi:hypothetical protein
VADGGSVAKKRKRGVRQQKGNGDAEGKNVRGERFEYVHDDKTTKTIFFHISSNIPWLHRRQSQRTFWNSHLKELYAKEVCLELKAHKDPVRSFSTWAGAMCKARTKFRLDEGRTSGVGTTMKNDAVDDVAHRWVQHQLGQDKKEELQKDRAALMRDSMTATAGTLDAKAAAITADRAKRFSTTKPKGDKKNKVSSPSAAVSNSPITSANARASFTDRFESIETQLRREAVDSQNLLEKLLGGAGSTSTAATVLQTAAAALEGPVAALQTMLTQHDASLVAYASLIHSALGITSIGDFADISLEDVTNCLTIPVLQRNKLVRLGKANNMGANCS